jgi:hypothetical protein
MLITVVYFLNFKKKNEEMKIKLFSLQKHFANSRFKKRKSDFFFFFENHK